MGVFQVYVWGSFGANVALFFGACCLPVPDADTCTEEIIGEVKLMGVFQVYV